MRIIKHLFMFLNGKISEKNEIHFHNKKKVVLIYLPINRWGGLLFRFSIFIGLLYMLEISICRNDRCLPIYRLEAINNI